MPYKRVEVSRPRGINIDLSPYELPNEIWSQGNNIDFSNHRTNKALGYSQVFTAPAVQPIIAMPWTDYNLPYWFYASETKVYRTNGSINVNVTRQTAGADVNYTGDYDDGWTGTTFNGVLILNNRQDAPQFYDTATSKMKDLTAWPTGWTTGVVRPFKNYLIALDVKDDTGTAFPSMVKWSDAAPLGGIPASWDPVNPAVQAGYNILPDTAGRCIEGKALNDTFFIYKSDAVWAMQFIGGNFIFSFRKVFSDDTGILSRDCVTEFNGKHFVVGVSDIYVHDGTSKKSVIANKMARSFYTQINSEHVDKVKCVSDVPNKEIWVYFPTVDSADGRANKALVWNWEVDDWSQRDLVNISYISTGVIADSPDDNYTWEYDNDGWNTDTTNWGENRFNPSRKSLFIVNYDDSLFYKGNTGLTINGNDYYSYAERIGIDFGDDQGYKYINSITPHIVGEGKVNVYVGTEHQQGSGIAWSQPQPFVVDQDYKVNFRESGRYIGVRFESASVNQWSLTGYTIEYSYEGRQ